MRAVDLSVVGVLVAAGFDLLETDEIVQDGDDRAKYDVEFGSAIGAEGSLEILKWEKIGEIREIMIFCP